MKTLLFFTKVLKLEKCIIMYMLSGICMVFGIINLKMLLELSFPTIEVAIENVHYT